jgi:hypothetical protein
MLYTKYIDQCCLVLLAAEEASTDPLIPPLVRSQQLAQRIFETFSYDDPSSGEIRGDGLISITSSALVRDVEHLESTFPQNFGMNGKNRPVWIKLLQC